MIEYYESIQKNDEDLSKWMWNDFQEISFLKSVKKHIQPAIILWEIKSKKTWHAY
jgi:hypothetical protein